MPVMKRPFRIKLLRGPYGRKDESGRYYCTITYGGTEQKYTAYARYLMEQHLGRRLTDKETVDHIDEDCTNDKLSNLQILSFEENSRKSNRLNPERFRRAIELSRTPTARLKNSLKNRGQNNPSALLTDKQVLDLRKAKRLDRKDVCVRYGISNRTLVKALYGVTYKHLPYAHKRKSVNSLTDAQVIRIRSYKHVTVSAMSLRYCVSKQTIRNVLTGKTYRHLLLTE